MRLKPLDIAKVVISVALVAYLFARVDLGAVAAALRSANYLVLLAALVTYLTAIALGIVKWSVLLAAQGERVPYRDLAGFTFTGLFFGNFLPTNVGGDLVRGYDLARHLRQVGDAAVSVLMDRLVGLLAFITMGAIMSALAVWSWGRTDLMPLATIVWATWLVAVLGMAAMLSRHLRALIRSILSIGPLKRLLPIWERLSGTLQAYREHPLALAKAFGIGIGVIAAANCASYAVFTAIGAGIPFRYVFLFNPLTAFAPLIVPSLGGLGVNQGAYDLLFATVGGVTTPASALTVSLLLQLLIYLSSLPGGVLWFRRRKSRQAASTVAVAQGVTHEGSIT